MDADIKKLWIDELRSGKYEQGMHALRSIDDKYCCLGVLCEIAVKQDVIPEPTSNSVSGAYHYRGTEDMGNTAGLPWTVSRWADLWDDLPVERVSVLTDVDEEIDLLIDLAHLNDTGVPFEQIADVINYFF